MSQHGPFQKPLQIMPRKETELGTPASPQPIPAEMDPVREPTHDVTVRLTDRHEMLLDELCWEHRRVTGRKVNRSELLRNLIEQLALRPELRATILPAS